MEIYKLSDVTPERGLTKKHKYDRLEAEVLDSAGDFDGNLEASGLKDADASGGELKITDMKQGVRDENRVNIYINEKFSFSLDIAQVVDLHLKVGMVVTPEQLAEYKRASRFGKMYQRALEWVLLRPRSERELRDYLKRGERTRELKERQKVWQAQHSLEVESENEPSSARRRVVNSGGRRRGRERSVAQEDNSEFIETIAQRLLDKGYVDDEKFARYYVENRFVKKGVSTKRLKMELMKKGVSNEIIERVLNESERDEADELQKMYAKKRLQYNDEKLIAYLCRQGFSYEMVKELVEGD